MLDRVIVSRLVSTPATAAHGSQRSYKAEGHVLSSTDELVVFEFPAFLIKFRVPPPTLEWKSIDLENPPSINNSLVERLRLNELLAAIQYRCNKSVEIGDDSETFTVCEEAGPIKTAFIATGNTLSSGMFEKKLGATSWTIFLPEGSDLVERLNGDVEVHYLTELSDWDRWTTWDMEYAVRGRTYDIAKMDLYAYKMRSFDQPSVNMTARHLALTIDIGSGTGSNITKVIGEWYQLLYWLFFSERYALIGATSTGMCGQDVQNCKYRVSMLRMDTFRPLSQLIAPSFGLGSPIEELKRLTHYMKASDCPIRSHNNFPTYCTKDFNEDSNVLLISYQESLDIPASLSKLKNFHVVTPILADRSLDLNIHNHAIGPPGRNKTIDQLWSLKTLENTVSDLYNESVIDLLLVDMVGGEFALLPTLLRFANVTRFMQLSIRGHMWSEENGNFRDVYWNLRQLENYGYSQRYGLVSLPRYDVVYGRK
ncbi:hypothetical protein RB195_005711 [Necator americanus]|uniref:Methyltransferase FkbM domain-containing protein n=1 Tax=Necator americanus TaxID=51031 RepID=A0ABR1BSB4_NECAM